ncbi:MAG: DUF1109 domain-containing protein [Hyphomicrobiales bacterium]|nr:DUF1109 domain-containing protein [Hyphomicrobiales bacterium]MBV9434290.1 DUF1109 domain-containing protein [Hyphomicrobiales bacterium]
MRTEELINALVTDEPSTRKRFDFVMAFAVALGALVAGSLFFVAIGFRPDIDQAVRSVPFLFKFVVTLSLATAAIGLCSRLARPGVPVKEWSYALAIPVILLALAVLAELMLTPPSTWAPSLIGSNSRFCLTLIPLLAIGPLACLLLALRQGASTRPGLSGAVAGLAASGIAATFYAANCTDDAPLFVATWYPLAIAMVVAVGYALGSVSLRW